MVNISEIDLPITFARNLNTIRLEFDNNEENYGKIIHIKLKSMTPSSINEWTYRHLLQPTAKINLTGLEYGDYQLEIKSSDLLINKYSISSKNGTMNFENIETNPQSIFLDINDYKNNNTRQFGGGGFGGALLTTGSFTMMAASGGF